MNATIWIHNISKRNKRNRYISGVLLIVFLSNLILTACASDASFSVGGPAPAATWSPIAQDRRLIEEQKLSNGIGRQVVNLLDPTTLGGIDSSWAAAFSAPVPYLLFGGFALDPKWYSNRVSMTDLPTTPIDFRQALGVGQDGQKETDLADLKVIYYPGDELVVGQGTMVTFTINSQVQVTECLNNPSQKLDSNSECTPYIDEAGSKLILAIERDLYPSATGIVEDPIRFVATRYSGTVIYAKKIVLSGPITTGGYDLVLVADEIEVLPEASIVTTPPDRPRGMPSGYDYGYSKSGYRAGDVVLMAYRIEGDLQKVDTSGGKGQQGQDNQQLSCQERLTQCKIEDDFSINSQNCGRVPYWVIHPYSYYMPNASALVFDAKYYCTSQAGVGGKGGDGGNFYVISINPTTQFVNYVNYGGKPGENGLYPGPKPHGPDALYTDSSKEMRQTIVSNEEAHGHTRFTECVTIAPKIKYFEQSESTTPSDDSYKCIRNNLIPGYNCTIYGPQYFFAITNVEPPAQFIDWCHYEGRRQVLDSVLSGYPLSHIESYWRCQVDFSLACPDQKTIYHRHCNVDQQGNNINCSFFPFDFHYLNQSPLAPSGQNGVTARYQVPETLLLKRLRDGIANGITSFEANSPIAASESTVTINGSISHLDYVNALRVFAPRSAELMLLKANYLYRSLTDRALQNNDADFVVDWLSNPDSENRILKAQYFYDSILYLAASELENSQNTDVPFVNNLASSHPFTTEIQSAYQLRERLLSGHNYFGFSPDFYFYVHPDKLQPYLDRIDEIGKTAVQTDYREGTFRNLAGLLLGEAHTALSSAHQNVESAFYASEVSRLEEKLKLQAIKIDQTLQGIQTNAEAITSTAGVEVSVDQCQGEIRDSYGRLVFPTIQSEIKLLEECAKEKPCDWQCYTARIFQFAVSIYGAAANIYGLATTNWSTTFSSLKGVFVDLKTNLNIAKDFSENFQIIKTYAGQLNAGEESTIARLKKGARDATGLAKNYQGMASGWQSLRDDGTNELSDQIAQIAIDSQAAAEGIQQNLTEIYRVQAQLSDDPDVIDLNWAKAHAQSLVDLLKKNQALNSAIPELQREHVLATQEYLTMMSEWEIAKSQVQLAKNLQVRYQDAVDRYSDEISKGQFNFDNTVRYTNLVLDRVLLLRYLYARSDDFLYLRQPSQFDFTLNPMLSEDAQRINLADADTILRDLISVINSRETGDVFDTIAPAQYNIYYTEDRGTSTTEIALRNEKEIAQELCPPIEASNPDPGCKLTKIAYHDQLITQLRETGSMEFEIYPLSLSAFRELSADEQRQWNRSYTVADDLQNTRVIDVSVRFLLDHYSMPSSTGQLINISHGDFASFRTSADGYSDFIFPNLAMTDVCNSVNFLLPEDRRVTCISYPYFSKNIQWVPFSWESVDTSEFKTYRLFGTSLRGIWKINIRDFLNQLSESEKTAFWNAFRGVEYRVHYVSLPGQTSAQPRTKLQHGDIIALETQGQRLSAQTPDGTVNLVSDITDGASGTRWQVFDEDNDGVVSLLNLDATGEARWLDGRTMDGSVGLAPSRESFYTGTHWEIYSLASGEIILKCMGDIDGNRWLVDRTQDSTVGLAPNLAEPFAQARWKIYKQ